MVMAKLNMRSKITVRWSTAPSDLGYGGSPTQWREQPGKTMSLRNAAKFAYELSLQIGQGTNRIIEYSHRGALVDLADIREALAIYEYEYRATQR